jgi:hypothetical protein
MNNHRQLTLAWQMYTQDVAKRVPKSDCGQLTKHFGMLDVYGRNRNPLGQTAQSVSIMFIEITVLTTTVA